MQRKSGKFVCQCPLGLKLLRGNGHKNKKSRRFQCPLGLIPHFYCKSNYGHDQAYAGFNALSGLYLISTFNWVKSFTSWEVLFQCPLGLIPHFYPMLNKDDRIFSGWVSMPSRAYTSFLQYPFKNLGFMRFPEPVFAGIYQNILTTAVFRAC